ncbi:MAG: group II intron maturase-specific domain-containing protein [Fermentimonas sp.]
MKLKSITRRHRGVSFEQISRELEMLLRGWLQYFKYASMKSKLEKLDGWLRRRLKCYRLKQCKRVTGIVRFLISLGVEKTLSWRTAYQIATNSCFVIHSNVTALHVSTYGGVRGRKIE